MRYVVRFTNAQHLAIFERAVGPESEAFPEGIYRALDVVVEADDARTALRRAAERLDWPHHEMSLVPVAVTSDAQIRGDLAVVDSVRALIELWKSHGLLEAPDRIEQAVGLRA